MAQQEQCAEDRLARWRKKWDAKATNFHLDEEHPGALVGEQERGLGHPAHAPAARPLAAQGAWMQAPRAPLGVDLEIHRGQGRR